MPVEQKIIWVDSRGTQFATKKAAEESENQSTLSCKLQDLWDSCGYDGPDSEQVAKYILNNLDYLCLEVRE